MKDEDVLRRLYEGFAMCGLIMRGSTSSKEIVYISRRLADAMLNAPEEESEDSGLASLKKRNRYGTD